MIIRIPLLHLLVQQALDLLLSEINIATFCALGTAYVIRRISIRPFVHRRKWNPPAAGGGGSNPPTLVGGDFFSHSLFLRQQKLKKPLDTQIRMHTLITPQEKENQWLWFLPWRDSGCVKPYLASQIGEFCRILPNRGLMIIVLGIFFSKKSEDHIPIIFTQGLILILFKNSEATIINIILRSPCNTQSFLGEFVVVKFSDSVFVFLGKIMIVVCFLHKQSVMIVV
ncbi:uncharacterized protein G2W53_018906 [Senna tora]|uniref:Uncharacterized protein n=1 Tax=Senna tora TaxID=362788 RepID=A0A834TUG4_9FABA|nr:uncharacterized protein G2W53_018906 [Senna tora]